MAAGWNHLCGADGEAKIYADRYMQTGYRIYKEFYSTEALTFDSVFLRDTVTHTLIQQNNKQSINTSVEQLLLYKAVLPKHTHNAIDKHNIYQIMQGL